MSKLRNRVPYPLPQWLKRKIEVNVYNLYEQVEEFARSLPEDTLLLDAGAGEGRFKPEFAHTKYIGFDLAVGDISWDYSGLDVIGELTRLPIKSGVFDVVICIQVLEHVAEPYKVLEQLARVLKSGGTLFLAAPQSWHQHQKPHDYYRYTSFGLRYLVEKVGLEVESLSNMGGYFWFISFQLQNINYWVFPKSMRGRQWTWPARAVVALVFQILMPLMLFYLDNFDQVQDETFGWICVASKPHLEEQ
jgi:SAM-dependent methyltransferase